MGMQTGAPGTRGEILDRDSDGRPDDCDCWDADLPCWPCYRDGFDTPNPSAGKEQRSLRLSSTGYILFSRKLDVVTKLFTKALDKYQDEGLTALSYASARYVYLHTIRPHLSCQQYQEVRGISVRSSKKCKKRLDSIFGVDRSWPQNHKKPNCDFIRKYVDKGDSVVVVGGGYGLSSVVAATQVGQTGEVLIYEGAKDVIDDLLNTLLYNEVAKQTTVKHAIVGQPKDLKSQAGDAEKIQPEHLPSCDLIEMDCEGAEIDIIPRLSKNVNRIIVETHPRKGAPTSAVETALKEQGWQVTESAVDRTSGDILVAE